MSHVTIYMYTPYVVICRMSILRNAHSTLPILGVQGHLTETQKRQYEGHNTPLGYYTHIGPRSV